MEFICTKELLIAELQSKANLCRLQAENKYKNITEKERYGLKMQAYGLETAIFMLENWKEQKTEKENSNSKKAT